MTTAWKQLRILTLITSLLLLLGSLAVQALVLPRDAEAVRGQEDYLYSIGWAKVKDENYADAKSQAVSQALNKGVESYIISQLGPELVSQNLERIVQELLPRANELVENFHILGESKGADKYFVIVKLKINKELAEQRLEQAGLLEQQGPLIKVLFMVLEDRDGEKSCWWQDPLTSSSLSATELALIGVFQEAGFQPINRILQLPGTDFAPYLKNPVLEDPALTRWGELFGADLVIYGKSQLYRGQEALLSLKAFSVKDGRTVCTGTQAQFLDPDMDSEEMVDFLKNLARGILSSLLPCIEQNIQLQDRVVRTIIVDLRGIKNYMNYRRFLDFLNTKIPGIKKVRQSRIGAGYVSLKVDYRGSTTSFVEAVMSHQAMPLEVERVDQGEDNVIFYLAP